MYLCYVDESGTPEIPGNTSHFILAGISIPIWHWRDADRDVSTILDKYGLGNAELHTAWILRKYIEQSRIPNFANLSWQDRRIAVERERNADLLYLQKAGNQKTYCQNKKNYRHTNAYIHLTLSERQQVVREVAQCISTWGYARLFAECVNKLHFNPTWMKCSVDEQAFEQLVSRFEQYLASTEDSSGQRHHGLLVHDNNETVAKKHTELMRRFHRQGTLWTRIQRLIETPLFVDSSLTRMVQVADLCSYALRRYLENSETDLFHRVFQRADRRGNTVVGIRHFTVQTCGCDICKAHRTNNRALVLITPAPLVPTQPPPGQTPPAAAVP
jgi:hypothetical protein